MNESDEFPIKRVDELGRLIYVAWNESERVINVYWNETNDLKIKYRFYGADIEIKAWNEKGKEIMDFSPICINISLPNLKFKNGKLYFKTEKSKLILWKKIIKESVQKKQQNQKKKK